jgi:WD40 repeat protein
MSMQMLRRIGAPAVHEAKVTAIALDKAHNLLFVGSTGPNIWVWNTKSPTSQPLAIMKGHKGAVTGLVYFSGMNIIISSSLDGTCIFWDDRFKILQALSS